MPPEVLNFLFDIEQCSQLIEDFTTGKSIDDFRTDIQLRSAVERQFITIGEALQQRFSHLARFGEFDNKLSTDR